jgi:hypothetical protein
MVSILIDKTILIYNKKIDILENKKLIYDNIIINDNIINLKYLIELNEFDVILTYYYTYKNNITEINEVNYNLLKKISNNFSYRYLIDIDDIYCNIYINLLKSIIDILKFKNIKDEYDNNIILSYDNIITDYVIINPDTLSDS